tara:strand:+ start:250 stop:987 length:738 start_codon:yes stop_codon:yes gene_type:complete
MNNLFDTYILCGGQGTRLKKISGDKPKPLVDINGTPLLDIIIRNLSAQPSVKRIALLAKYRPKDFQAHYKEKSFNGHAIEVLVQTSSKGTGGALLESRYHHETEHVAIMNGDTLIDFSFINEVDQQDLSLGNIIFCAHVPNIKDYGSVEFDLDFKLTRFNEKKIDMKKQEGFVYSGVAILSKRMLELLDYTSKDINFEKDIVSKNRSKFKVKIINSSFLDVGTPERFELAKNKNLNSKLARQQIT